MTVTPQELVERLRNWRAWDYDTVPVTEVLHAADAIEELLARPALPTSPDDLLDTEELAALLGVRPASLRAMRAQPSRHRSIDGLPEPLRLVSGRPVWERAAVEAWVASRPPQRHTAPRAEPAKREPVKPVEPTVAPVADEVPWIPWPQAANRPI